MSVMDGGIMHSQIMRAAAGYAAPALLFGSFPSAALVPGQMRRASDLNNAVLISDGTNWSPMNGQAVIANGYNVNITLQSLTEELITSVAFPAGFPRAGSRFRIWMRGALPCNGSVQRILSTRIGASGAGISADVANTITSGLPATFGQFETVNITTVLGENTNTRQSTAGQVGLHGVIATTTNYAPIVDFTAPWEIAFTGKSAAETAQTGVTATWDAGVATYTSIGHGHAVGDKIVVTTFTPTGYNGTKIVTGQTANTWTAAIAADPGAAGEGGTTSRISNMTLVDYLIEWLQ